MDPRLVPDLMAAIPASVVGLGAGLFCATSCRVRVAAWRFRRPLRALREGERAFRAVYQGTADAMLLLSTGGEIVSANPAAAELLGWRAEELSALRLVDLVVEEEREGAAALIDWARETGEAEFEIRARDAADTELHLAPPRDGRVDRRWDPGHRAEWLGRHVQPTVPGRLPSPGRSHIRRCIGVLPPDRRPGRGCRSPRREDDQPPRGLGGGDRGAA